MLFINSICSIRDCISEINKQKYRIYSHNLVLLTNLSKFRTKRYTKTLDAETQKLQYPKIVPWG